MEQAKARALSLHDVEQAKVDVNYKEANVKVDAGRVVAKTNAITKRSIVLAMEKADRGSRLHLVT